MLEGVFREEEDRSDAPEQAPTAVFGRVPIGELQIVLVLRILFVGVL